MKRDDKLIRQIVEWIIDQAEIGQTASNIHLRMNLGTSPNYTDERPDLTQEQVDYHLDLAEQAGWLERYQPTGAHKPLEYRVTYRGHDYFGRDVRT